LDSQLNPFMKGEGGGNRSYTSRDCINIETQLGYTYGAGSLEGVQQAALQAGLNNKVIRVAGINRGAIRGSFMISAHAVIGGKKYHLGTEAVLSRWHVEGCANCPHLEAKAFIALQGLRKEAVQYAHFEVEVRTRDGLLGQGQLMAIAGSPSTVTRKPFRFEVR
jgi:tyrosinase